MLAGMLGLIACARPCIDEMTNAGDSPPTLVLKG